MHLKIQGLVLRVTTYKETDALLTVLTHSHGKITVKASGLRRNNSPLTAACQLLAYSEFTLFEYRGMYTIQEANSIELFHLLRKDLDKLSLASYFSQVAEVLCQEDIPNPELLSLVLNCLFGLSKLQLDMHQVKAVFELRSACIAGYMPDLGGCSFCGNADPERFDVSEGKLECVSCGRYSTGDGLRMPISAGILACMRYICTCDRKQLFGFRASKDTFRHLSEITECYLSVQLERSFSALDFYKTLTIDYKE